LKKFINKLLRVTGYELRKAHSIAEIGSQRRPVGRMDLLLEDLKVRGLNCHTILDIGANKTNWSRIAARVFPDSGFFLIEPQVEMEAHLAKFCIDHNNSFYYLTGVGSSKSSMTLTIWDDFEGSSLLPKPDDSLKKIGKQREIEITTIDDLLEGFKIKLPELIKLDIQGFELEALKGAGKTFGYTEVYIIEVSLFAPDDTPQLPLISDVINFMLEKDYVVYDFAGFLRRPSDGALGQCDICFVKRKGFLRASDYWN
jgi:FkbM family methyltransferase